jgi:hypothetical protein
VVNQPELLDECALRTKHDNIDRRELLVFGFGGDARPDGPLRSVRADGANFTWFRSASNPHFE